MTRVAAVAPVLPEHRYPQEEITSAFADLVVPGGERRDLLERLHAACGVRTRHLALPLECYPDLADFGQANDAFIRIGTELGERAVKAALGSAGLAADDVDVILSTSVTGLATPSLDARLVGRLGMRPDVKRLPVFGLGCVAGAAGVARLHDHLAGHPDDVAVLLSVELCSLTVQRDDDSTANLVASGLFGDGAAAVVLVGESRARAMGVRGPAVVSTRSRMYAGTEDVMGWEFGASGFRIVLDATVSDVVQGHLGADVAAFLAAHGLGVGDIGRWIAHPGGPKVLQAVETALGIPGDALAVTRSLLAGTGNLSSASVLHVLAHEMADSPPRGGSPWGLMFAMGPGFCSELLLLRWGPHPDTSEPSTG